MRNKKGVSPVIATVLLIGIVITLALIIFVWSRGFIQEAVTKFGGQNVELVCDQVQFQASSNASSISITNNGNVPIYDIQVKQVTSGGQTTKKLRSLEDWPNYGLNSGDSVEITYPTSGDVTLIPILLGDSKNGKKSYVCDENAGVKI